MNESALKLLDFFHYFNFLLLGMVLSTKKRGSEDSSFRPHIAHRYYQFEHDMIYR